MVPLVATRLGIDPAIVSAPLISTLVDVTGLVIYYIIAISILVNVL
jgi:magnesium transporter